jgi:glycosyltransferase involved in cell wall biosynthesis
LSDFSRKQFITAGFDQERIKIKPNFINFDPGCELKKSDFALYIGRFSPEKGVDVLLEAWKELNHLPLKIIGGGSGFKDAEEFAKKHHINVEFLGQMNNKDVIEQIKKALFVVIPSRCNENFPRIVVEAFACAKPIIASRSGALAEIIEDGKTGLLFESGNSNDLVNKVELMISDKEINEKMGKSAREEYEKKYTGEKNYKILIDIYRETIQNYTAK